MAYLIGVVGLLSLSIASGSGSVKVYLNDCITDLTLKNFHNYTGKIVDGPIGEVKRYSSVEMIEYEYATRATFGSLLDANINYYKQGEDEDVLFHWYLNVNTTGDVYSQIITNKNEVLAGQTCVDVPLEMGKYPSVMGIWIYWPNNQTLAGCKSNVPNDDSLDTCIYNVTHTQ